MGTALAPDDSTVDPFNPPKKVGGQTYAPTPTAPTLPFATAGQGASSTAPTTTNATAGQGLTPTQPHPLATSDPLAFAPPAGSTLPIAQPPVGGAPGAAPNTTPDAAPSTAPMNPALNVGGGAVNAQGLGPNGQAPVTAQSGQTYGAGQAFQGTPAGWVDPDTTYGTPGSLVDPTKPTGAQYEQQNNLDDWWAAHGTGPRYSYVNGVQVDNAAQAYKGIAGNVASGALPNQGTGLNSALDAAAALAQQGQNNTYDASLTNGGFAPGTGPNELPLTQMPDGSFQNQNGMPASQGGNSTSINNQQTGGQTPVDVAIGSGNAAGAPNGFKPSGPSTTPAPGGSSATPAAGGGSSLLPPSMAGPVASYGGPAPLAPSSNPNDLTNTTLKRDPSIDRFALAKQNLADFRDTTNPAYEASLRDANRYAFANGRGYSGIENNSIGDLASQRDTALRGEQDTLLNQALNDTISDQFKDLGVSQQQQGFQAGQQQTGFGQGLQTEQQKQAEQGQAFNQDLQTKQLNNLLQNTAFGQQMSVQQLSDFENSTAFQQALQQFYAGQISDPAAYFEQLAQQWARPVGGVS
jgi:hypothetical protein